MLNGRIGERREIDGVAYVDMARGEAGFCLYGPYERREPGAYRVNYDIRLLDGSAANDQVCAILDVAAHAGQRILAQRALTVLELRDDAPVTLPFDLPESLDLEYRVYAVGTVPLRIADRTSVVRASPDDVSEQRNNPILEWEGIRIHASTWDDIRFVDEIFFQHTYRLISQADLCCIDIGMNVGLTSLMFARMPNVRIVHGFEPFPETYERAVANFSLNPELAAKIVPHRIGLAAQDGTVTVQLSDTGFVSGSANLFESHGGRKVELDVRDAGAFLAPIVGEARSQGQQVILKIDCEGSEFAVFASLDRHGLLGSIDGLAVEWHRTFAGRTQVELIAPLLAAGFIVIDLSPEHGNGFFYAVRTAAGVPIPTPLPTGRLEKLRRLFA